VPPLICTGSSTAFVSTFRNSPFPRRRTCCGVVHHLDSPVARGLSFCETIAEDVLRPLYHNNRSPTCSTLRNLRTTSPQRGSPNRRIVPTAARMAFCQLASFTLVTIATTVRCAKASFGHALIGASSHGKRRTSWGNVNRRPPRPREKPILLPQLAESVSLALTPDTLEEARHARRQ
jgi:hypothetical protein